MRAFLYFEGHDVLFVARSMKLLLGRDLDEAKFDHQLLQCLELVLLLVHLRLERDVLLNQLVQFLVQELLLVLLLIPEIGEKFFVTVTMYSWLSKGDVTISV